MIRKRLNRNLTASAIVDLPEISDELENLKNDVNTNTQSIAQIESEIENHYTKQESDEKFATITQIDEANQQIHQNQQDIETLNTKLRDFVKTKKITLNDANNKQQWNSQNAIRTYRYDFSNLGIDKSNVLGVNVISNDSSYEVNKSVITSYLWLDDNTLSIMVVNTYTQNNLLRTYNQWFVEIKYLE